MPDELQRPNRLTRPPIDHPDRAFIAQETHARPVAPLDPPARVRRAVFMASGRDTLRKLLGTLTAALEVPAPPEARQLDYEANGYRVTAEFHNEFATLTWTGPITDTVSWPAGIQLELFAGLPLLAAMRIDVTDTETIGAAALAGFETASLSYADIFAGTAQAATDFRQGEDGFTRFEVAAGGCGPLRRGVIVRRLLEIETYRNLALLGLPLARSHAARIEEQEAEQAALMRRLGGGTTMQDNHAALDALHELSLETGRTMDAVAYRFAASHAYANVLAARLARLDERAIGEYTTFARYLENRIEPAMATLTATDKRLDALAARLERVTDLLNARISLGIEQQNQKVLDTISRTARSQYQLQHTVEGLSILAISYYALAVLGDVLRGFGETLPEPQLVALAAPPVVLAVWWLLRRRTPRP